MEADICLKNYLAVLLDVVSYISSSKKMRNQRARVL